MVHTVTGSSSTHIPEDSVPTPPFLTAKLWHLGAARLCCVSCAGLPRGSEAGSASPLTLAVGRAQALWPDPVGPWSVLAVGPWSGAHPPLPARLGFPSATSWETLPDSRLCPVAVLGQLPRHTYGLWGRGWDTAGEPFQKPHTTRTPTKEVLVHP